MDSWDAGSTQQARGPRGPRGRGWPRGATVRYGRAPCGLRFGLCRPPCGPPPAVAVAPRVSRPACTASTVYGATDEDPFESIHLLLSDTSTNTARTARPRWGTNTACTVRACGASMGPVESVMPARGRRTARPCFTTDGPACHTTPNGLAHGPDIYPSRRGTIRAAGHLSESARCPYPARSAGTPRGQRRRLARGSTGRRSPVACVSCVASVSWVWTLPVSWLAAPMS